MNPSLEAELWAQDGIDYLCRPYRSVTVEVKINPDGTTEEPVQADPREIDLTEALALMRAAYAKGYSEALSEPAPLDLPEAAARATTLGLMLPV